jgi:hypothetical protein
MSPIYVPGKVTLKKESVAADPYYNNVSLLLHGDGTNGSTTIIDSSPSPKTVTAFGDAQISTAQSKFGGSSIAFDGTEDYLTVPANNDLVFGTNNFTIEGWILPTQINARNTIVSSYPPWRGTGNWILVLVNGKLAWYVYPNSTFNFNWTTTTTFPLNQWSHFALTRESNNWRLFYNGIIENTAYQTVAVGNLNQLEIGRYAASPTSNLFNGYIDDLRITKGIARYTANFTPPTAPFPEVWG